MGDLGQARARSRRGARAASGSNTSLAQRRIWVAELSLPPAKVGGALVVAQQHEHQDRFADLFLAVFAAEDSLVDTAMSGSPSSRNPFTE